MEQSVRLSSEAEQVLKLSAAELGIPIRRLGQSYDDDIPDFWFANNAAMSMFFSAFSATLPVGEGQFIHSVRLFQDRITDPVLQAQVRAFIGQEAHHSREHQAFNAMLTARGIRVDRIEKTMKVFHKYQRRWLSPEDQLAMTVCGEHLTALMSDYILRRRPEYLDQMAPALARLWAWHAIEETEHKAVAFDVYDQLIGDRKRLYRVMALLTVFVLVGNTATATELVLRAGQMRNWTMWRDAFALLGTMLKETQDDYMAFYQKGFHPWDVDNRNALEDARRRFDIES